MMNSSKTNLFSVWVLKKFKIIIKAEDSSEKCLLELRKIESKIEQRKLLGIKTAMTYDAIQPYT